MSCLIVLRLHCNLLFLHPAAEEQGVVVSAPVAVNQQHVASVSKEFDICLLVSSMSLGGCFIMLKDP